MEETNGVNETKNYSLEIRTTSKGEKSYTYKVRADNIEDLTIRQQQVKQLAELECGKDVK